MRRLTGWGKPGIVAVLWLFFGISFALRLVSLALSRQFYALQSMACCAVLAAVLYFRQTGCPDYCWFGAFWVSFLLGYGLWLLDVQHLACDPTNHWISGHALWHWFDALALYCAYRFCTRFPQLRQAFRQAGFGQLDFQAFPSPYNYFNGWGHVVVARP